MAKQRFKNHALKALHATMKDEPVPAAVFLPPAQRVSHVFNTQMPEMKDNLVRIQNECDPIGMLIAIATGIPVATHYIDGDGMLTTQYETLPLNSPIRERILKSLADKIMPRMSITKTTKREEANGDVSEWEATLGNAASRDDDE